MNNLVLRPSQAGVWSKCSGYPAMIRDYGITGTINERAEQGTAVHDAVSRWVADRSYTPPSNFDANQLETFRAVIEYLAALTAPVHSEVPRTMPKIHPSMKGTPDIQFCKATRVAVTVDIKHGRVPVDATENMQLISYASGHFSRDLMDLEKIEMVIIQPHAWHPQGAVRSWTITKDELVQWEAWLRGRAAAVFEQNPPLATGEHCTYCESRHMCPALRAAVHASINAIDRHDSYQCTTAEAIGAELDLLTYAEKLVKIRKKGLEQYAQNKLREGKTVPGWALRPGRSFHEWKPKTIQVLEKLVGYSLHSPVSPNEAEKLGVPKKLIEHFVVRKPGRLGLRKINMKHMKEAFK